jgi:hypothetical protein
MDRRGFIFTGLASLAAGEASAQPLWWSRRLRFRLAVSRKPAL